MELRQLRYFIGVAEELHYGKAAEKLYISASALSQQIHLLENEIGVELFYRSKRVSQRKVELTDAGIKMLTEAKRIIELCDRTIEDIRRIGLHNNSVRMGLYQMLASARSNRILNLFSSQMPDLHIEIIEYPTYSSIQEALMVEEIDLGVTQLPIRYPELMSRPLGPERLSLLVSASHPFAQKEYVTMSMMRDEKWVVIHKTIHPYYDSNEELCRRYGFSREPNIVQKVYSLDSLFSLVSIGKGIALVPSAQDISQEPNIIKKPIMNEDGSPMEDFGIEYCMVCNAEKAVPVTMVLMDLIGKTNDKLLF
jgi:DNA-binding transcriptional LysR family regulator